MLGDGRVTQMKVLRIKKAAVVFAVVIVGCGFTACNFGSNQSSIQPQEAIQPSSESKQPEIDLPHQRYTMAAGKMGEEDCIYCYYVTEDGELWRWIEGTTAYERIDTNVQDVSSPQDFIIVLKRDGTLYGEGQNIKHQLGVPLNPDSASEWEDYHIGHLLSDSEKASEQILQNVKMVSVGRSHTIALKQDNTVWVWGENGDGQIGNGEPEDGVRNNENLPVVERPTQVMSDCIFVAAGNSHSAAITETKDLYVWGDNSCGEIGNGERGNGFPTASNLMVTKPYLALKDVKWVRLLNVTTYAITSDDVLWAWGKGYESTPQKVAADVKDVIGHGDEAAYLLDTGGKVYWTKELFNLICDNVAAFDGKVGTVFSLIKKDGSLEVYTTDSLEGFIPEAPLLKQRLSDADFR